MKKKSTVKNGAAKAVRTRQYRTRKVESKKTYSRKRKEEWQSTLTKIANVLERDGWCRGTFQTKSGKKCFMGAYNTVVPRIIKIANQYFVDQDLIDEKYLLPVKKVLDFYNLEYNPKDMFQVVTEWNDNERGEKTIIKKIRRVVKEGKRDADPV